MKRILKALSTGTVVVLLVVCPFAAASAGAPIQGSSMSSEKPHAKHENKGRGQEFVRSVDRFKLIGSKIIPNGTEVKDTVVGGLSGLTYHPEKKKWFVISDDRSEVNPARFYTAKLKYSLKKGFKSVHLKEATFLKQPDGTLYPSYQQFVSKKKGHVPDFESIRFDSGNGGIWYTSEGDRSLNLNPVIRHANLDGTYLSGLPLPDNAKIDNESKLGFRDNLALEGSTFSADGLTFWTAMEGPLLQDGSIPTVESGAISRITQYDRDGNVLAQYAYPIDAIPARPGPGKFADNGVTDILSINDHEFLMLERSAVQSSDGSFKNYIRIYKINTKNATDVSDLESLKSGDFITVEKQLVLNMNELGLSKLDNVEGMSWGKRLKNGHSSLVLVSDNNFNVSQVTQFIALEVLPEK